MYKNGLNFATGLPIDVMFGSRMGFPAELNFFYHRGLHTRTAVVRNPYVSWAFLFIFVDAYSKNY